MQIHQSLLPSLRLELFPKSTIDVFITVLEADGDAACVTAGSIAASAALADAGIEMLGLVAACSACTFAAPSDDLDQDEDMETEGDHEKLVWLDPNADETARARGTIVLACMPALGTVTNVRQTGAMSSNVAGLVCYSLCLTSLLPCALTGAIYSSVVFGSMPCTVHGHSRNRIESAPGIGAGTDS